MLSAKQQVFETDRECHKNFVRYLFEAPLLPGCLELVVHRSQEKVNISRRIGLCMLLYSFSERKSLWANCHSQFSDKVPREKNESLTFIYFVKWYDIETCTGDTLTN